MDAPLALYRRYRPECFDQVLGQDHVTVPLRQALAANRVHHAYLFSGPRGCGKTTSARILARALNCAQAPVAEPCGECQSCRDLARNGPGSLDVIEIDAASHGGVDDARDLRERASFGPMSSRYKIYIVDEAHMVTMQGFNALLKIVEEPPPHVKFVFATTEPDKVLSTIRSRTHHYPFRLLLPRQLTDYLAEICQHEGITVEPAALPMVVRAGGGSARDTLSVLDQLLGGAGPDGLTLALATGLLGFTPESLLDEVVDAFAAGDGAAVFRIVDRVVEGGREPRRFVEDLLTRIRDLIVVSHVPDAARGGLLDISPEQGERLAGQAARFGAADLVRSAEVVATALGEVRGATAPRLLLELMCARVLLPAVDDGVEGVLARLDRLERRMAIAGVEHSPAAEPAGPAAEPAGPAAEPVEPAAEPAAEPVEPAAEPAADLVEPAEPATGLGLVDVRRAWPDVVARVSTARRLAWVLLSQNARVHALDGRTLTVAFASAGSRDSFASNGCEEVLRQVLIDVLGVDWRVESIVDPTAAPSAPATPGTRAASSVPGASPARSTSAAPSAPARSGGADPAGTDPAGADAEDADVAGDGGGTHELLTRELGAQVIEEIPHRP